MIFTRDRLITIWPIPNKIPEVICHPTRDWTPVCTATGGNIIKIVIMTAVGMKGDTGEHFAHVVKGKGLNVEKGICVKLGAGHMLSACFDTKSLSYRAVWQDGWVNFQPFRWGSSRGANIRWKDMVYYSKS